MEQINLHPDMKLTSKGKFINGGFVSSMAIHADIAIATLKQKIQFSDSLSFICLPTDKSPETEVLSGSFMGWNVHNKNVEIFNASIALSDGEVYEVTQERKEVNFAEGEN